MRYGCEDRVEGQMRRDAGHHECGRRPARKGENRYGAVTVVVVELPVAGPGTTTLEELGTGWTTTG